MNYSIIIPNKNRADLISYLMETLFAARKETTYETEVFIIDDSDAENAAIISESADKFDCKVVTKSCSVAAKRNYGASLANYDTLLFLDSDVRVPSNLLLEYDKVYEEKKARAVVGALEFEGKNYWFWEAVKASPYTKCFSMSKHEPDVKWGCSCNLSVEKALFFEVGGFSEDFKYPAGEDVDFGLNITDRHIRMYCAKDAVVYHSNETWRRHRDMRRRITVYGKADLLLVEKHPDQVVNGGMFRRILMYFIMLLSSVAFAALTQCWWLLTAPVAFWIIENIGVAMIAKHEYKRFGKISLAKELAIQHLIHIGERAYAWECIRTGHFRSLNKQLIYSYRQAVSTLRFSRYIMFLQWTLFLIMMTAVMIIALM